MEEKYGSFCFSYSWCDVLKEKDIKECFKYNSKELHLKYAGVYFDISDYGAEINLFFCDDEKLSNTIRVNRLESKKRFKMFCEAFMLVKKLIGTFKAFESMRQRKLHITLKEANAIYSKIIRSIDKKECKECEFHSKKLQDTFKI